MTIAKLTLSTKALKATLASEKNISEQALLEYELAFQTNPRRGHVYSHDEVKALYPRSKAGCPCGATKITHLKAHNGKPFENIVVKRYKDDEWCNFRVNQLIAEIDCWQKIADTETAEYVCPILKFFKSKSDKVPNKSETMKNNVVIIAQKAVKTGDLKTMCRHAEKLNRENGFDNGEYASDRYDDMVRIARKMHWQDCIGHPDNTGVIFDYHRQCYKAVFIDTAL